MRPPRALAVLFASVLIGAAPSPAPSPASPLAGRGFLTDRATAERAIAFQPFVPAPFPVAVALEPPFHWDPAPGAQQISRNEGIAYAYELRGRIWLLDEWPRNGGTLAAFPSLTVAGNPGCADVHAIGGNVKPHGVAWTTPHGLVFTLLPDGFAPPQALIAEWRRLVGLGACR